jgi:hypothetical protein
VFVYLKCIASTGSTLMPSKFWLTVTDRVVMAAAVELAFIKMMRP